MNHLQIERALQEIDEEWEEYLNWSYEEYTRECEQFGKYPVSYTEFKRTMVPKRVR